MIAAIIPARGNSKGIERKNLTEVGDKPLLQYTLEAAVGSKLIDYIAVSSEDYDILRFARENIGDKKFFNTYERPEELSQDHVQVDEVALYALRQISLYEFCEQYPDTVVILQPTSPFRTAEHIDEAIELYQLINRDKNAWEEKEIVFSAYEPGHTYEVDDAEKAEAWLFDPRFRLGRQQEHDVKYAVENGAIYVIDAKLFGRQRSFRHPNMRPYWMDKWESLEVDDMLDLYIANCLMGSA